MPNGGFLLNHHCHFLGSKRAKSKTDLRLKSSNSPDTAIWDMIVRRIQAGVAPNSEVSLIEGELQGFHF